MSYFTLFVKDFYILMKITFIIPQTTIATVDVSKEATADDVRKLLVEKHNFQDGKYTFIYLGNFLPESNPFKMLPENAKVVVFIKSLERVQQEEKEEKEKKERIKIAEDNIREFMKISQLQQLYTENDIWSNLPELAQVSRLIQNTSNLYEFVCYDINHTVCPGLDPNDILTIMLYLLDYSIEDNLLPATDFEIDFENLPETKQEMFNRVQEVCKNHDKSLILAKLKEWNWQEGRVITELKALPTTM